MTDYTFNTSSKASAGLNNSLPKGMRNSSRRVKTQDAVIRNFEIIGEAAKRLSPEFTHAHDDIPWRRIAGFRAVLIHHYIAVDLQEVWNVAVQQASSLRRAIEAIMLTLPDDVA